ncbi:MAG: HEAT repeat domain-containing protein, partial [Thermoplasmata archaeon]
GAARTALTDKVWSVRGAAAECLGTIGEAEDLTALRALLEDPHPWPRRGAIYALGRLGLSEAAPRIREELADPEAEVRLAAVWSLGQLEDDGARELLVTMLRHVRPVVGEMPTFAQGTGAVKLQSDAESRLFDALVQALGRLTVGDPDPLVVRALLDARARVPEEEIERNARLPAPEVLGGHPIPTLRSLFDTALPAGVDEEDLGC